MQGGLFALEMGAKTGKKCFGVVEQKNPSTLAHTEGRKNGKGSGNMGVCLIGHVMGGGRREGAVQHQPCCICQRKFLQVLF